MKKKLSCERCGSKYRLQWHHVDPTTKLFNISAARRLRKTPKETEAERAKCVLLCHLCHQVIHSDHLWGGIGLNFHRHCRKFLATDRNTTHRFMRWERSEERWLDLTTSPLARPALLPNVWHVESKESPMDQVLPRASTFEGRHIAADYLRPYLISAAPGLVYKVSPDGHLSALGRCPSP